MNDIDHEKDTTEETKIEEIKAKYRVVCICKGIKQGRIVETIKQGCSSIEELNKKTGCGSGDCKGTRCGIVLKHLLQKYCSISRKNR